VEKRSDQHGMEVTPTALSFPLPGQLQRGSATGATLAERSVHQPSRTQEPAVLHLQETAVAFCAGLATAAAGAVSTRKRRTPQQWRVRCKTAAQDTTVAAADTTAIDDVLQQLRSVKDPGLGTDIVACGFVRDVKADRERGRIDFRLEVGVYEDKAREAVARLPWAKDINVLVAGSDSRPSTSSSATTGSSPPQTPTPRTPPALERVKSIVAVSSCKGGVGKSFVSVNLAFELQKQGARVGIFDCDVYGPSLPLMVRSAESPQMEMYEDEQKQKHVIPVVHEPSGVKLVSFGYAGKAAVMRGSMVTGLISQLMLQTDWGDLDYLILDLPPGTGDIHLTLAQVCKITAAVIVTTPQKLSVIDVERGISMFSQLEVPSVAVVQNMSYLVLPNGQRQFPFGSTGAGQSIADTFGIEHVFELPLEAAVSEAGDTGVPLVVGKGSEDSPAAAEISNLAVAVTAELDKIHANTQRPVVTLDSDRNCFIVELPNGEIFGVDPAVLRHRDKGAGAAKSFEIDDRPVEIRDMGNYAIVIRWSDGFVQVAPHRQLIYGDEKGPMPRIALDTPVAVL